jgi:hypothetical protein
LIAARLCKQSLQATGPANVMLIPFGIAIGRMTGGVRAGASSQHVPDGGLNPRLDVTRGRPFVEAEQQAQMSVTAQQFEEFLRRSPRVCNP